MATWMQHRENFLTPFLLKDAFISIGKNNTVGIPSDSVLKSLNKRSIKIFRTDINGDIILTANKKGKYSIKTEK